MMSFPNKKRRRYFEEDSASEWKKPKSEYGEYDEPESQQQQANGSERPHKDTEPNDRLPFELKEYVRGVAEGIASENGDNDDLAERCMEECKGYEPALCYDPDASRHLETICRASLSGCIRFCRQLLMNKRKSLVRMCTRAVGSRCLESILYQLRNYLAGNQLDDSDAAAICEIIGQIGELLLEEFDTLVAHMHSTHILRAFGRVCCGLEKPDRHHKEGVRKNKVSIQETATVKEHLLSKPELKSSRTGIVGRILDWKSMYAYYYQESISCLVQEYIQLEAAEIDPESRSGFRHLIASSLEEEYKDAVLEHWMTKQASRVWETIIQHCPGGDAIERLYRECLAGKLADLAMHPFANFPLQRLLERCDEKALAKDMIDELLPHFDHLWSPKRCGVVVALAAACKNNGVRQKQFKKALRDATGCRKKTQRQHLLSVTLRLGTFDEATNGQDDQNDAKSSTLTKDTITTQGSALVQHLLHFRKPKPFTDSLLQFKANQLLDLACHPAGSHILDAFISSETITEDQKAAMASRLKEPAMLLQLACDKYGSRLVDTFWSQATEKDRSSMAESLTTNKAMTALSRTPYGKILWTKYQLERFKKSPKEWRKFLSGVKAKKRLLQDLL